MKGIEQVSWGRFNTVIRHAQKITGDDKHESFWFQGRVVAFQVWYDRKHEMYLKTN